MQGQHWRWGGEDDAERMKSWEDGKHIWSEMTRKDNEFGEHVYFSDRQLPDKMTDSDLESSLRC